MIPPPPLAEFNGTVALVTGSGSGIGRAIAVRYATGGGDVVVLGRRTEPLEQTPDLARAFGVRAEVVGCDVPDADADAVGQAVDRVVAEHGRLDALVNNAAGNFVTDAETLSANGWRAVVDTRGIRVNCISPGPTETEGAGAALWPTDEARRHMLDSVPAGRFTTPEKVAESAAFLLDARQAGYINGDVLSVDGGQWLGKAIYTDAGSGGRS
jgi:NAD(P)-dependent dehydrogenase (short-subunit alcohol dehydrogenase family)